MAAVEDKDEVFHTFQDDIMYQKVKGDCRRSSFVSSDQQILSKSHQKLRSIEKSEKMVSFEYKRQQTALMTRLEQLQDKQQKLGLMRASPTNGFSAKRRHSTPNAMTLSASKAPSPTRRDSSILLTLANAGGQETPRDNQNYSNRSSPDGSHHSSDGGTRTPTRSMILEARRQSAHEIQEEVTKLAREKFETIMAGRRATIADCDMPQGCIPSAGDLSRLTELMARTTSIEEERA